MVYMDYSNVVISTRECESVSFSVTVNAHRQLFPMLLCNTIIFHL